MNKGFIVILLYYISFKFQALKVCKPTNCFLECCINTGDCSEDFNGLDCDYSTDEFKYYNENICKSPNVQCKFCCREGGCASWEKCHAVLFMSVIAFSLLVIILVITFCCLCKRNRLKQRSNTELFLRQKGYAQGHFPDKLEAITEMGSQFEKSTMNDTQRFHTSNTPSMHGQSIGSLKKLDVKSMKMSNKLNISKEKQKIGVQQETISDTQK